MKTVNLLGRGPSLKYFNEIPEAEIIVLANDFKVDLINLGIPEEKVKVRTTMVKSSDFTTSREDIQPPFQILHSSHLRKQKGIYELLDSVPYVIEKYPDTNFVFLGIM